MDLQRQLDIFKNSGDVKRHSEKLLVHHLHEALPLFNRFVGLRTLQRSPLYQKVKPDIDEILYGTECGLYHDEPTTATPKKFYRAVFWNLSGELNYESFLDVMKNHPILSRADFFLFSDADLGMARTQNRNLVRSLALELNHNYVFATSYLYLNSYSQGVSATNQQGLVGQAIMTPHPITRFVSIPLPGSIDPLQREMKRLGSEKALLVEIKLPQQPLQLICTKLDSSSSPAQRASQLKSLLHTLHSMNLTQPQLMGGDFNTTTYNSRHAIPQFFSFLNKIVRGFDYICEEHHAYPERYFDKAVFQAFEKYGWHYQDLNNLGKTTMSCSFADLEVQGRFEKTLSHIMVKTLQRFFYHGPEHLALKVDWFAGTAKIVPSAQPQAETPQVLSNLYCDKNHIASHYPVVLDFEMIS